MNAPFALHAMGPLHLSFAPEDSDIADWLRFTLESAGHVFVDHPDAAKRVLALWSEAYFADPEVRRTARAVRSADPGNRRGRYVPILALPCTPPASFSEIAALDITGLDDPGALRTVLLDAFPAPPPPSAEPGQAAAHAFIADPFGVDDTPEPEPEPRSESEPEPEPKPEGGSAFDLLAQTQPGSETQPELPFEPHAGPVEMPEGSLDAEPHGETAPAPVPTPEPVQGPDLDPEPEAEPEPEPERPAEPDPVRLADPEPAPVVALLPAPQPVAEPEPATEPLLETEAQTAAEPTPAPELDAEPATAPEPEPEPEPEPAHASEPPAPVDAAPPLATPEPEPEPAPAPASEPQPQPPAPPAPVPLAASPYAPPDPPSDVRGDEDLALRLLAVAGRAGIGDPRAESTQAAALVDALMHDVLALDLAAAVWRARPSLSAHMVERRILAAAGPPRDNETLARRAARLRAGALALAMSEASRRAMSAEPALCALAFGPDDGLSTLQILAAVNGPEAKGVTTSQALHDGITALTALGLVERGERGGWRVASLAIAILVRARLEREGQAQVWAARLAHAVNQDD